MDPIYASIYDRLRTVLPVEQNTIVNGVNIRQENGDAFFEVSITRHNDSFMTIYRFSLDDANYILNEDIHGEHRKYTYFVEESNQYYEMFNVVRQWD